MSSDSRWTGGLANREWQSGTAVEQPVDKQQILSYVRDYLDDCRRFMLPGHPSERGVLQVVFAPADAHKQVVAAAFRHLTRGGARKPVSAD